MENGNKYMREDCWYSNIDKLSIDSYNNYGDANGK